MDIWTLHEAMHVKYVELELAIASINTILCLSDMTRIDAETWWQLC